MRVIDIVDEAGGTFDRIILDFDQRSRRRAVYHTVSGTEIILDQARPRYLRGGQAFVLEDGVRVLIEAKAEELVAISCPDVTTLVRIAWHLGNRHLPTQIIPHEGAGELRIRADHVIEALAAGLGGSCHRLEAPFDPERGAYDTARSDHYHHDHHHGDHGHGHE